MTQNLKLVWCIKGFIKATRRNIEPNSIEAVLSNPTLIRQGRMGREEFIGEAIVGGRPYPVLVSVSASPRGILKIVTVYPNRRYKEKT